MKKLNVLGLALLALTLGFTTSCSENESEEKPDFAAPTVTFTQGDQTVDAGSSIEVTGTVEAPGGIGEIVFFKDDASFGESITTDFDTDTTHSFTVTIPGNQVEATFSFEVKVTDDYEKTGNATATITVSEYTIQEYTSVKMYMQDAGNDMAFNAEIGASGTIGSMAADDIDLLFLFQNDDARKHGLYAPSDEFVSTMGAYGSWPWSGTHNATKISESNEIYEDVTAEDIAGLSVSGTSATVLQVDDVIAFETVDGYKGLIKVTATHIELSTNGNILTDTNMTFDVKIVAPASSN